ncbi:MAG: hypothetical protein UW75_C0035G0003 [Parcubacteria group bacterium GW2011_GWF2_44_8]|nr:MAG: hypothetical protein UW75_C0035G0003 [Parcubacteria group bacterium GW2011_GWF2_44_8]
MTTKIISVQFLAFLALSMGIAVSVASASEVTGTLSSNTASTSQAAGTVGGEVLGTNTISGSVSGGSSSSGGRSNRSSSGSSPDGAVLGAASTLAQAQTESPAFPNAGFMADDTSVPVKVLVTLTILLAAVVVATRKWWIA